MIIQYGCAILRAIEEQDFDLLFEMINSPTIERLTGGWNLPVSSHEQRQWISSYKNNDTCFRLMVELNNGYTVGMLTLSDIDWKNRVGFLHYKVKTSPEGRIRGDMYDASMGLLKYAFEELGLNCVEGLILSENTFSLKLARKLGFKEEGILRQRVFKEGHYQDQVSISILRDEFLSAHGD